MNESLRAQFDEYAAYHTHPLNRAAHFVGFMLMAVGGLGLLDGIVGMTAVLLLQALLAAVHLRMDRRLGLAVAGWMAVSWAVGHLLPGAVLLAMLLLGVALPVYTHVFIERRWPKTADQLLRFERIGHLWFLDQLLRRGIER